MNRLGIDFLSVFTMPPTDLVRLAAALGCRSISTVLEPFGDNIENQPAWSLKEDPALRRELKAVMADHGVALALGEGFLIVPGVEARDHARNLELHVELGAERINTMSFDPDMSRTFDQFAIVAEMAADAGLPVVSEFGPCFSVPDLPTALAAQRHVGRRDFRLLVDVMHLIRSGSTAADLAALDPDLIGYVQMSDVPLKPVIADYVEEGMYERLVPGEGELPLADIVRALPPEVVVSLELPQRSKALAGISPSDRLEPCVRATRRLLDNAAAETA